MLTKEILDRLAEPFAEDAVSWKPAATNNRDRKLATKALAVAYVDARDVIQRLNEVTFDWEFRWAEDGKDVKGSLTVCGVTREDTGEQGDSEQGQTRKAAVSDALKRCAVHFGVGLYLYRLEATWVDYDGAKGILKTTPKLPAWALPGKRAVTTDGSMEGAGLRLAWRIATVYNLFDPTGYSDNEILEHMRAWLAEGIGSDWAAGTSDRVRDRIMDCFDSELARDVVQEKGGSFTPIALKAHVLSELGADAISTVKAVLERRAKIVAEFVA